MHKHAAFSPVTMNEAPGRDLEDSKRMFWMILLLPACTVLLMMLLGPGGREISNVLGLVMFFGNFVTSNYCGFWIARRFLKAGWTQVLAGIFFSILIIAANAAIVIGGCSRVNR
jgi:hypothetical protein